MKIRKRSWLLSTTILTCLWQTTAHAEGDAQDHYGFGPLMVMTDDGAQFGAAYVGSSLDLALTLDGNAWDTKNSSPNTTTEDMGATVRIGYARPLGNHNFLSAGVHVHQSFFGKDPTGDKASDFRAGPYVQFRREFPGTGVSLVAFVLPVSYDKSTITNVKDASGHPTGTDLVQAQYRFFQEGGVGVAFIL